MKYCYNVKNCGKKHQAKGMCNKCYLSVWRKKNPDSMKEWYEENKPDMYIVYGLHEGDMDIKYVGCTQMPLQHRLNCHRTMRDMPHLEIHPIAHSGIKAQARMLERLYIHVFDTYTEGWNKYEAG